MVIILSAVRSVPDTSLLLIGLSVTRMHPEIMHCKTAVFVCQTLSHQFLHSVDLHIVRDHRIQMDHQIRSVFFQTFPLDLIHHLMTCPQIVVFVKFHMNACIPFSRTIIVHHQVMTASTYFPEYNIENLNTKINIWGEECSYAKYYDYSGILLIGSVCKFCSLLCIIKFFICRTHIKEYLRTSILLAMCLLGILLSYYLQFQKQSEVLEQRAYYVRSKLVMGNPAVETDYDNFQISYEKVENELRYIDDKIFYGAFGIEISAGKVAKKSITL